MPSSQILRIDNIDLPCAHADLRGKRYLYHYTKAQTALGSILKERRLRLSPHSDLNDPKEARNWVISLAGRADGARPFMDVWQAMENVRARTRVLCFTSDGYNLSRQPIDIENYWDSRGFARPTMWAHYGENHRGIALVFDRQRLLTNAVAVLKARSQVHYGHVSYRMPDETDGWTALSFSKA